jgi:hypothetical protein
MLPICRCKFLWCYLENALFLFGREELVADTTGASTSIVDPIAINFISVEALVRDGCAAGLIVVATIDR